MKDDNKLEINEYGRKSLISVIIPVYNQEKYLARCINSVIEQTYRDLEIILVNDGSTDGSLSICQSYQKEDNRIVIIDKENGGLSSARNSGLDKAQGSYISFIDSDDFVSRDYIKILYESACKYGADLVQCRMIQGEDSVFPKLENRGEERIFEGKEFLRHYYDKSLPGLGGVCVIFLYKKELFKNIRFPEGKIHEDVAVLYKIAYAACKTVYINQCLYYYYINMNSITKGKFTLKRLDWVEIHKEKLEFLKNHGEIELHNRALQEYEAVCLKLYYLVKKNLPENKKEQRYLLNEIRCTYKRMLPVKEVGILVKAACLIAYYLPYIFGKMCDRKI